LPPSISGGTLSWKICVSVAKYEGETVWTGLREGHTAERRKHFFVDLIVLAGVIVILALCNCFKLFTSY
jgi:hypothetical protein